LIFGIFDFTPSHTLLKSRILVFISSISSQELLEAHKNHGISPATPNFIQKVDKMPYLKVKKATNGLFFKV
jgi:hypothetical protein